MNAPSHRSLGAKATLKDALAKREIWILILVGVLMFVSTLVLEGWQAGRFSGVVLRGIQDLGLSFIEAALVMAIIEMRASREQIEQSLELIGKATDESKTLIAASIEETKRAAAQSQALTREAIDSVFRSVYQKNVPDELVAHYETMVFNRSFFRRGDEYIYTLRMPVRAKPEDFMTVSVYHKYTMYNLTRDDLEHEFRCETSLPPNEPTQATSQYFDLRVDKQTIPVGKGQVVQYPGYKALVLTHKVLIPRGGSRSFESRWNMVRKVRDVEVLTTIWPSDGIIVDVIYDPAFEVDVNALHPIPLAEVPTGDHSSKWSLAAGMVQGQGICLSWEPKSA